jgi:hypothetical protein
MKQNCLSLPDFVIQAGFLYRTFGSVAANECDATVFHQGTNACTKKNPFRNEFGKDLYD